MRSLYQYILLLAYIKSAEIRALESDKVKISIFYESLCPDCINFFREQLTPNLQIFYDYITLDLIPYGNAKQEYIDNHWEFTCQHGEPECYGNKIQACSIEKLEKKSPKRLYRFINCFMSSKEQDKLGPICAKKYNVNFTSIKKCANNYKGDELLSGYGNRTHDFKPAIKWVPWIVFNDVYKKEDDEEAAENLKSVICRYIDDKPEECDDDDVNSTLFLKF